jgi:hypothetical protein
MYQSLLCRDNKKSRTCVLYLAFFGLATLLHRRPCEARRPKEEGPPSPALRSKASQGGGASITGLAKQGDSRRGQKRRATCFVGSSEKEEVRFVIFSLVFDLTKSKGRNLKGPCFASKAIPNCYFCRSKKRWVLYKYNP